MPKQIKLLVRKTISQERIRPRAVNMDELQNSPGGLRTSLSRSPEDDDIEEDEGELPWYKNIFTPLEEDLGRVTKALLVDRGIPAPLTELAVSLRRPTPPDALEWLDTGAIRPRRGNSTVPLWMYRRKGKGSEEFAWQRTSCFLDDQTLRCYDHNDPTGKPCAVLDLYHIMVDDSAVRTSKDQLEEIFKVCTPSAL